MTNFHKNDQFSFSTFPLYAKLASFVPESLFTPWQGYGFCGFAGHSHPRISLAPDSVIIAFFFLIADVGHIS